MMYDVVTEYGVRGEHTKTLASLNIEMKRTSQGVVMVFQYKPEDFTNQIGYG